MKAHLLQMVQWKVHINCNVNVEVEIFAITNFCKLTVSDINVKQPTLISFKKCYLYSFGKFPWHLIQWQKFIKSYV